MSAINRGGLVGFENGESVSRTEARAIIVASSVLGEEVIAFSMSCSFIGDPAIIVMPGDGVMEAGLRTSAVMVWFRESASLRMREPVRPVAPSRRICILSL